MKYTAIRYQLPDGGATHKQYDTHINAHDDLDNDNDAQ